MLKVNIGDFLFQSPKTALLWLVVRVYVGLVWLEAGLGKVGNPKWTGDNAGAALAGFVNGALKKTGGAHPDVQSWYAVFLENIVLPNAQVFSYLVAFGELLVGVGLILGVLVGITAFFAATMNFSYLLSGAVSTNPILFLLAIFLMLAWRVAGRFGLDRYILPRLKRN